MNKLKVKLLFTKHQGASSSPGVREASGRSRSEWGCPAKIVGLSKEPLMVPEAPYDYETDGYRSYTLFPCATILEDDGTVRIYYGACDTVVALATAKLDDLIDLCKPV